MKRSTIAWPEALLDAADSPAMMVRVALMEPGILSELVQGKIVDGIPLQVGDYILLVALLFGKGEPHFVLETSTQECG